MKSFRIALSVFGSLCLVSATPSAQTPTATLFVDCRVAPGGTGTFFAPVNTITAAMAIARTLSSPSFVINVAEGVCNHETLPILLNRTVLVLGARIAGVGPDGLPNGQQSRDTLVTSSNATTFFQIAAPGVQISRLSIDGQYTVQPDNPQLNDPLTPLGVSVVGQQGYILSDLRIDRIGHPVRSEGSTGYILNSYFAGGRGPIVTGGPAENPAVVQIVGNRIVYRVNGVAMAGAGAAGTSLRVTVANNDLATAFRNSGPTNPAGIRASVMLDMLTSPPGSIDLTAANNRITGAANYGVMLHAGQPVRNGSVYSGHLQAAVLNTVFDPAVVHRGLVTFTNARATVFPCELNPACQNQFPTSEYLRNATYDISHSGEMDGALIDHPRLHPVDGYALLNTLKINGHLVDYQTFVVVP